MSWPSAIWARLQSLGFVVFAAAVIGGLALMLLPLLQQRHAMQVEARRLEREIAREEAIEKQRKLEIDALRTDPAFVERTARDTLNVARPNETIFRFEPSPAPSAPARSRP